MDGKDLREIVLELLTKNEPRTNKRRKAFPKNADWDAFYANRDVYMYDIERQERDYMEQWVKELNERYFD